MVINKSTLYKNNWANPCTFNLILQICRRHCPHLCSSSTFLCSLSFSLTMCCWSRFILSRICKCSLFSVLRASFSTIYSCTDDAKSHFTTWSIFLWTAQLSMRLNSVYLQPVIATVFVFLIYYHTKLDLGSPEAFHRDPCSLWQMTPLLL